MQFNHDNMTGVHLAADLVNLTVTIPRRSEIAAVLRDHQIRRPHLDQDAVEQLHVWGIRLRAVFSADTVPTRIQIINQLLADGASGAYLTIHDQLRPHLHFAPDHDDIVGRVRAVTAGGLALFTVQAEGHRLGVCARPTCTAVFVDTSRNARRTYCTARCGNNDAVQRHRSTNQ